MATTIYAQYDPQVLRSIARPWPGSIVHGRGPRIQGLRHSLAVKTIIDWYRRGLDPDREMLKLSA
jgi:hypothetical protein